jgi:hypothetical protein
VVARHIGKYILGNPTLIVQNMPGAGRLTEFNWFEDLAKPDRCVHRVFAPRKTPSALVQQLRDAFAGLEDDKEFLAELKRSVVMTPICPCPTKPNPCCDKC